jgi:hypothetical protein
VTWSLSDHGNARVFRDREVKTALRLHDRGETRTYIAGVLGTRTAVVDALLDDHGRAIQNKRYRRREDHHSWKGGRIVDGNGYIRVIGDFDDPIVGPMLSQSGYAAEHRVVMARQLGRPLEDFETVHHKNGQRDDNRLENLQLRFGRHGSGQVAQCRSCGSADIEFSDLPSDASA